MTFMENIDILYLIQPLIVVLIAFVPLAYFWFKKRTFTSWVFLYSFLAFFIAIAVKVVFQLTTISLVESTNSLFVLGVFYGLQTALLEVGLAYVFASYGVKKSNIDIKNAAAYGTGLAFWENGILLGLISLINILLVYVILGSGTAIATTEYNALVSVEPSLFYPISQALPLVALGILERITSIIGHFCWGYLCIAAAYYRKVIYLWIAMPLGFIIDFLVPFAGVLTLPVFEAVIFVIAVIYLIYVLITAKTLARKNKLIKPPSNSSAINQP
jgi:uncharacterized membrane protein YhfC